MDAQQTSLVENTIEENKTNFTMSEETKFDPRGLDHVFIFGAGEKNEENEEEEELLPRRRVRVLRRGARRRRRRRVARENRLIRERNEEL